jgi:hypothetical protein
MEERALLLMSEHGIEEIIIADADTATPGSVTAHTITRADVEQDEDAAAIVAAIIARHDPVRLTAVAPTLIVSTKHVEKIVAEMDAGT